MKEELRAKRMKADGPNSRAISSQGVNGYDDLEYVGNITVGTPATQHFIVALDTGSANFWIPDSTCTTPSCYYKNVFNANASSTYSVDGRQWQALYGDGSNANGFLGIDAMTFGGVGESQLRVENQIFGQAIYVDGFDFDPIDGILGLGFTFLADSFVVPPVINAIAQNLLDEPIFTVWMKRVGKQQNAYGGQFTYGGQDPEHCEPIIAYQQLSIAGYWQFRMRAVGVGNYLNRKGWDTVADTGTSFIGGPKYIIDLIATALGGTGWDTVADTGTSFIGGPKYIIDLIATALGGTYNMANDMYLIPCGSEHLVTDNIVFYIGDQKYEIQPVNYIIKNAYGGQFTYGGQDPEHCEPIIAYQQLSIAGYWQFRMRAVGVGNYLNRKGWDTVADTGTSFIGGPKYIIDLIATALGGTYNMANDMYLIPCGSEHLVTDNIVFYIGDQKYEIQPVNYIIKTGFSICAIGVFAYNFGGYGPTWILGTPLIRQYCLIHDVGGQRIGFAPSKTA
ncbi:Aspartic protease 6 [Toxocara canis]|uniref:Aspartic protease 6 n=1 Tax=Toxocara canis TaxID=6265 RepID=A0A0B2W534_TOXCA|nr:Aspartic protease 6 [Toxocara canis]